MNLVFYLSLSFIILIFSSLDNMIDFDFWARLVVGKSFFQTNSLFNFDFQSFGTTHQFIDHEWGSSLIFYLIQNNFEDIGLFVFKSLLVFLIFFISIKAIKLEDKNVKLHILFFFFIIQALSYNIFSTIRCQIFSFFFFVFYIYILKKVQKEKCYRILWTIPALNIVWANLHGGFALGLFLIAIFLVGEFLNNKKYVPYLITLISSLFTTLINPYGIKYVSYIIDALKLNRTHIVEWQSAFFNQDFQFFFVKFKIFFLITILIFIFSIFKSIKEKGFKNYLKSVDKVKYLVIVFTMLISLKSMRFQVFYVLSVLIFCYCDFYRMFNKQLPVKIDKIKDCLICVLLFVSLISHLMKYKFINTVNEKDYPIYVVEFLKINDIKGNIFTMFHNGSYVSYKLYPNNQIFMDGRYEEVYDNSLIDKMGDVFLADNYQEIFEKFHFDILILDKIYPVSNVIKSNPQWFLAFEDKNYSLFLRNIYKNKEFKKPTFDLNYYNKTKFETKIDWLN